MGGKEKPNVSSRFTHTHAYTRIEYTTNEENFNFKFNKNNNKIISNNLKLLTEIS